MAAKLPVAQCGQAGKRRECAYASKWLAMKSNNSINKVISAHEAKMQLGNAVENEG
jgi:hypothetical protein